MSAKDRLPSLATKPEAVVVEIANIVVGNTAVTQSVLVLVPD